MERTAISEVDGVTEPTDAAPLLGVRTSKAVPDDAFRKRSAALGDETRFAIYREIADREIPLGVAELVERFGLNHNTVRQHLAKLVGADLVEPVRDVPRGPGRPPVRYRLTARAAAEWNDDGPYERLSLLLLEVATTGTSALEVGRAAGREMAVAESGSTDPVDAFTAAVTAQGFAPRTLPGAADTADTAAPGGGDRVEVILDHCPFARAAEIAPEVVCALHRGMVEGLAEQVGGIRVTGFEVGAPRDAGCRVCLVHTDPDGRGSPEHTVTRTVRR